MVRTVTFHGVEVGKAQALAAMFKYRNSPSSADRLKCVQQVAPFGSSDSIDDIQDDSALIGGSIIILSEPITTLVVCEEHIFLCIASSQPHMSVARRQS